MGLEARSDDRSAALPPRRQRRLRRAAGALPNLIIIGAQKCGTSGLHYHLGLHPEVSMSKPKELNFFIEERNWPRGEDWYRRHFDPEAKVRGEASPNYTAFPQHVGVPERMASVVPDAKLIYLLRDPLERIAAHWVHNFAKRREKGTLAETLSHPNTSYLQRSQYAMQLQQFLNHFPREQIMILDQEDFRKDRADTLRRVFEFAGADPDVLASGLRARAPLRRRERPGRRSWPCGWSARRSRGGAGSFRRRSGSRSTSGCR